jgi:hypothetical protein
VSEVSIAAGAEDFDAKHSERSVGFEPDIFVIEGLEEGWPSGAGFEFGIGFEEGQIASDAVVDAGFFVFEMSSAECGFGAFVTKDFVLLVGELLFPFFVGFDDFIFAIGGFIGDGDTSDCGGILDVLWLVLDGGEECKGGCGKGDGSGEEGDFHDF